MSLQTIARRYAVALADVVIERGEAHSVQEELLKWGSMVQSNPLLQESFSNPTIPYEKKRNVLKEIIARTRVCRTTANFLQVLLSNQRVNELVDVAIDEELIGGMITRIGSTVYDGSVRDQLRRIEQALAGN